MWWIYNSSYHSLVTRTILTNKWDKSTFPSIVESQKNSFTTRVWPLCVGMWGMMCLWWCRQLGADVEARWVPQEHASYLCIIFGSKLNDAMNFLCCYLYLYLYLAMHTRLQESTHTEGIRWVERTMVKMIWQRKVFFAKVTFTCMLNGSLRSWAMSCSVCFPSLSTVIICRFLMRLSGFNFA